MATFSEGAAKLAEKFDDKWGPFTKSLAGHPKTALAISAGAGLVLGILLGWLF